MEDRPAAVHRMASFTRRLFDATIDAGGGPTAKRQKKMKEKQKKKKPNRNQFPLLFDSGRCIDCPRQSSRLLVFFYRVLPGIVESNRILEGFFGMKVGFTGFS